MTEFGKSVNNLVNGGRFINFRLAPGEKLLQCPYDSSHWITNARIGRHLAKCRNNWKKKNNGVEMETCRWNAYHVYPKPEIAYHEENCSDAASILEHLVYLSTTDTTLETSAIKNDTIKKNGREIEEDEEEAKEDTNDKSWDTSPSKSKNKSDTKEHFTEEEDWEEECERNRALNIVAGYDPRRKLMREAGKIIQCLPGVTTKSEREEFRASQAQLFLERLGDFNDPDVTIQFRQSDQQNTIRESKDFQKSLKFKRPLSPTKPGEPPSKKRFALSPKHKTST